MKKTIVLLIILSLFAMPLSFAEDDINETAEPMLISEGPMCYTTISTSSDASDHTHDWCEGDEQTSDFCDEEEICHNHSINVEENLAEEAGLESHTHELRELAVSELYTALSSSDLLVTSISKTSAVITWTTTNPATSVVNYGNTADYGVLAENTELSITHSMTIEGLSPATDYYFSITSCDETEECVVSGPHGFITADEPVVSTKPSTTTSVVEENKRSSDGLSIIGKQGIYPVMQIGYPWVVLTKPSSSPKFVLTWLKLTEINEGSIKIVVDATEYEMAEGTGIEIDLDEDGTNDIALDFINMKTATKAKFYLRSTGTVIVDEELLFESYEDLVESTENVIASTPASGIISSDYGITSGVNSVVWIWSIILLVIIAGGYWYYSKKKD